MKLLTQEIRRKLPPLYATEDVPTADKLMVVKFFTPDSEWTWYACEFDGEDRFFGFVDGMDSEWGYFSLSELERLRGPMGLPVERDLYFSPTKFSEMWFTRTASRRASRKKVASGAGGLLCIFRSEGGNIACEIAVPASEFPSGPPAVAGPEGYVSLALNQSLSGGMPAAREWAANLGWVAPWGDLEEWLPRGPMGAECLPVERIASSRTARRTAADYQPGASDEFAGSGGPYSSGEYPDDDPAFPDGYDRAVSSDEAKRPEQMTRNAPADMAGVDTAREAASLWAKATSQGEHAYRSARVAKYAVENGGQQWSNRGEGFELEGKAWVTLHGDTTFTRWAKSTGVARPTSGGLRFTVPGKSHDRAAAYAKAVVATLTSRGIPASFCSQKDD